MNNHWNILVGYSYKTLSGDTVEIVDTDGRGTFKASNGFWYDSISGRDGWTVRGVDHPHPQDLMERVYEDYCNLRE